MRFVDTPLAGVVVLELERHEDTRGFFARTFCAREFTAHGLDATVAQSNISFTKHKGTLRGLHYQVAPHAEAKLVSCLQGAIYDVAVDLRHGSPTFGKSFALELSAAAGNALFIAAGLAHGFQSLTNDVLVHYQMSAFYDPSAARGVAWDDPTLAIRWPMDAPLLSPRDANWPRLGEITSG